MSSSARPLPQLPPDPRKRFYTGIGSSRTPPDVCALLMLTARHLAQADMILRTGPAKGADDAFARGAGTRKEIYLPHTGFGSHRGGIVVADQRAVATATAIAAQLHPSWQSFNDFARRAHIRAVYQILGTDLQLPSAYLICFAPSGTDGLPEGSNRTSLALARLRGIPVYNLAEPTVRAKFRKRLEELAFPG